MLKPHTSFKHCSGPRHIVDHNHNLIECNLLYRSESQSEVERTNVSIREPFQTFHFCFEMKISFLHIPDEIL